MPKSSQRDYYEILGVSRTASVDEIKASYRKCALKWHPDRNPENKAEAEVKFRESTEAYSILSDAQKRQVYDTYGHAGLSGSSAGVDFSGTIFQDFHDIFGDFFGFEDMFSGGRRGGGRGRSQRGADLRYDMTLTFEEASAGVATKVKLPRQEYCEACNGTGAKKGTGVVACQTCSGRGQLAYQQGFFTITRTCPACQGAGQIVRERCVECRGQGRIERERTIELRIPPGVDTGTRLRVAGEGEPGAEGEQHRRDHKIEDAGAGKQFHPDRRPGDHARQGPSDESQREPAAGLTLPPVPVQGTRGGNHVVQQVRRGDRRARRTQHADLERQQQHRAGDSRRRGQHGDAEGGHQAHDLRPARTQHRQTVAIFAPGRVPMTA